MIVKTDLLSLNYYKKAAFTGSVGNMRYRIEKIVEGEGDDSVTKFKVTTWPGPFAYDKSNPDTFVIATFDFSDQGLSDVCDYLNEKQPEF